MKTLAIEKRGKKRITSPNTGRSGSRNGSVDVVSTAQGISLRFRSNCGKLRRTTSYPVQYRLARWGHSREDLKDVTAAPGQQEAAREEQCVGRGAQRDAQRSGLQTQVVLG